MTVLGPPRRAVADRPALVHGLEDSFDEQVGPAETGVLPRDVVGVNDSRSGDNPADPRRQRRLASVTASVYGQDDRAAGRGIARFAPGHRLDECAQQFGAPRPRFWLLGG
jgi:hypothetical protein